MQWYGLALSRNNDNLLNTLAFEVVGRAWAIEDDVEKASGRTS